MSLYDIIMVSTRYTLLYGKTPHSFRLRISRRIALPDPQLSPLQRGSLPQGRPGAPPTSVDAGSQGFAPRRASTHRRTCLAATNSASQRCRTGEPFGRRGVRPPSACPGRSTGGVVVPHFQGGESFAATVTAPSH